METTSLLSESMNETQDGKHLVFLLGDTGYGIPILDVSEIIGVMPITSVPKTPDFLKGIINLRGKIIPVMDLRLKFGMEHKEFDAQTCIIIVNLFVGKSSKQMGVLVDTVSEVFDIPLSEIDPPPSYGEAAEEGFLNGIGKAKGKLVMLLNIAKVLYSDEVIKLLSNKTDSAAVVAELGV